ncbi:importin-7-like, partial [Centruroides sculpturatus]|uniref:importin-7-like n=1 Tax=Centruroides sculpturatus TaxID=218467 RepID=UPI000C6DBE8D
AHTFNQVLKTGDESSDERAITAMGILNTIDTILSVMEEQKDIMSQLEPIVLNVVGLILTQNVIEFYEEAMSLIYSLSSDTISQDMWKVFEMMYQTFQNDGFDYFTDMMPSLHNFVVVDTPAFVSNENHLLAIYNMCKAVKFYEEAMSLIYSLSSDTISQDMWKVFEMMYQTFQNDGFDYFTDMMPSLHNFVVVDTPAFVSNENHLLAIYNMCKAILNGDAGEDAECHAAKLLEVVILQCKGQIDQCIPSFVELVLERLTREVKTSELRTMCLQVVIAALYYNSNLLIDTLEKIRMPNSTESITSHFIKQWIHDTDCFLGLHDRKMCVLGLCTLITMSTTRPPIVNECAQQIIPSILLLFDGLKWAYAYVLESDEDDIDEKETEYLERISAKAKMKSPFPITSTTIQDDDDDDDDDDEEEDGIEETALESYTTPLDEEETPVDEYIIFKDLLQSLQAAEPNWYNALTSHLNTDQQKALQEVFLLADQRKAAAGNINLFIYLRINEFFFNGTVKCIH